MSLEKTGVEITKVTKDELDSFFKEESGIAVGKMFLSAFLTNVALGLIAVGAVEISGGLINQNPELRAEGLQRLQTGFSFLAPSFLLAAELKIQNR